MVGANRKTTNERKKMRPKAARTTEKSRVKVLDLRPNKDVKGGTAVRPDKQKQTK
jgi:hypothetical protein